MPRGPRIRQPVGVVLDIHLRRQSHLPQIALARRRLGLRFPLRQRRQQQPRENRNNRNHDQQFDERERSRPLRPPSSGIHIHIVIKINRRWLGSRRNRGVKAQSRVCQRSGTLWKPIFQDARVNLRFTPPNRLESLRSHRLHRTESRASIRTVTNVSC